MTLTRTKPTWASGGIHTPGELARKARRLDRRNRAVEQALSELQRGASLHLSFSPCRHWRLSTGVPVSDEVGRAIIALPDVVGVGDSLFEGEPSQTFRHAETCNATE
jgi:hypothetical protein